MERNLSPTRDTHGARGRDALSVLSTVTCYTIYRFINNTWNAAHGTEDTTLNKVHALGGPVHPESD
eukprot:scaffold3826_cov78-Phaeocystis_antarctica.AAC.1